MTKYTPRQLTALRAAISHYEAQQRGEEPGVGLWYCKLCDLYWRKNCKACPVFKKTGFIACNYTPYRDWAYHKISCPECDSQDLPACPEGRRLHQAELDFLRSLLPRNRTAQQ